MIGQALTSLQDRDAQSNTGQMSMLPYLTSVVPDIDKECEGPTRKCSNWT